MTESLVLAFRKKYSSGYFEILCVLLPWYAPLCILAFASNREVVNKEIETALARSGAVDFLFRNEKFEKAAVGIEGVTYS